jgi:hypothetical protein
LKKPVLTVMTFLFVLCVGRAADFPDMPPVKEGMWKIHSVDTAPGQPPTDSTMSLCRNHAYDQHVRDVAQKTLSTCSTLSDVKLGSKRALTISCKISGSTITTKSVLTATGDNYYRSESETTYSPALYGQSHLSSVNEQTYVGACPSGMAPGDRMLANGEIQHRNLQLPAQH